LNPLKSHETISATQPTQRVTENGLWTWLERIFDFPIRQEKQKEKGITLANETKKCALRHGPYIPTTAELAEELERTSGMRRAM
jgi:hypothetical protein